MPPTTDITVVIPAYNAQQTVAGAVQSVLDQRPPADVIVVDDGSTDRTADAARAAGAKVIRQHNAGPAAARNKGLEAAMQSTQIVVFLDADDVLVLDALNAIRSAFAVHPNAAICIGSHVEGDKERSPAPAWISAGSIPRGHALGTSHVFCTTGLAVHSRAIIQGLRFDPALNYGEDRDFVYRVGAMGDIAVIENVLVYKSLSLNRMTSNPAGVARWLSDQVQLTQKHWPSADTLTRAQLAQAASWVVKHAARMSIKHPGNVKVSQITTAVDRLGETGMKLPLSVRKWVFFAKIRSQIR